MKLELGMIGIYLPRNELCYISRICEDDNTVDIRFVAPHYMKMPSGKENSYLEEEQETLSNAEEWFKPSDYEIFDFLRDVGEILENE